MTAIIFDTETTGTEDPGLVEAAWMRVSDPYDMRENGTFRSLYNPGKPILLGAMATHHITDEDVADQDPASTFSLPSGVEYLIGHNIDFDWQVIGSPPVKRICTLALARQYWPTLDSHTLGALLYYCVMKEARDRLSKAHSALVDVQNTFVVMDRLLDAIGVVEATTWETIWHLSEQARAPKFMPFGKHKGSAIADMPRDYKRWLLDQPNVDPYLAQALKK